VAGDKREEPHRLTRSWSSRVRYSRPIIVIKRTSATMFCRGGGESMRGGGGGGVLRSIWTDGARR